MVTCKLMGQMANQMFIIATAAAQAWKVGDQFAFPKSSGKRSQFPLMFPSLPTLPEDFDKSKLSPYRELVFGVHNEIPKANDLYLLGYFQSEKYFKEYRGEIINLFDIPKYDIQKGIVSVHVRRGDYIKLAAKHPPVTISYLLAAMNQFADDEFKFMFFSDDIAWCKENFQGDRFLFSEGKSMKEDMGLMASCEHNIIANSTYSWWGAWLNQNPDKIVIAPKQWFGPGYQDRILQVKDIIPETWIKL